MQIKTLAKRRGELSAWPNVPSPVLDALQEQFSEFLPTPRRLASLERAAKHRGAAHRVYRLGWTIAKRQRRFGTEDERSVKADIDAIIGERDHYLERLSLDGAVSPLTRRRIAEAFHAGLQDGIQGRIRTEETAVELSKALGGDIRSVTVKRVFARFSRFMKICRDLERAERENVTLAFVDRYRTPISEQIEQCFVGARKTRALDALTHTETTEISPLDWQDRMDLPFRRGWRGTMLAASPAQLRELDAARLARGQSGLAEFVRKRVREVGVKDLLLARLAGDEEQRLAAEIRCGLDGIPEFWPGRYFAGQSASKRLELQRIFSHYYPGKDLISEVRRVMSLREQPLMLGLISHGVITPAKLCYISMAGIGTDERTLVALLSALTRSEIDELETEFPAVWVKHAPWYERPFAPWLGRLRARLRIECGGDTWLDLCCYLEHEQLSPIRSDSSDSRSEQARAKHILARTYDHERSGKAFKALSFFSAESDCMDHDCRAVLVTEGADSATSEVDAIRTSALIAFAEISCHVCRDLKHFVGNMVTNMVAGITVFATLLALSILKLPLLSIMTIVALISGSTRISLKGALKGRGYHQEELVGDLMFGALDGMTLFASRFLRQIFLRSGTTFATKLGLTAGAKRYVSTLNLRGLARSGFDVRLLIGKRIQRRTPPHLMLTGSLPPDRWLAIDEPPRNAA